MKYKVPICPSVTKIFDKAILIILRKYHYRTGNIIFKVGKGVKEEPFSRFDSFAYQLFQTFSSSVYEIRTVRYFWCLFDILSSRNFVFAGNFDHGGIL